jgi:hypothetical protein
LKKFDIGEVVVDLKTGEIGRVFDADIGCNAVIVSVSGGLDVWLHKNIEKYIVNA